MRVISYPELRERGIRYTRQRVDRLVANGDFPAKVHIGPARIGWVESEVEAWLKSKADALLSAGRDADLLIAVAYFYERKVRFHLDYTTLREKLPMFGAKRLILTHMSPDMLGRVSELRDCEAANDGLEVEII